jgi:hypothetical protein
MDLDMMDVILSGIDMRLSPHLASLIGPEPQPAPEPKTKKKKK